MRHKSSAQSLVETALILPLLLFICFAIIDMGWYIYGFGTIYNAARRGAEKASQLPPWPRSISSNQSEDGCLGAIYKAVQDNAVLFPNILPDVHVNYVDTNVAPGKPAIVIENSDPNASNYRQLGGVIQVSIQYKMYPLTPLLTLGKAFGLGGVDGEGNAVMPVSTSTRRTIESMGFSPGTPDGCAQ